MSTYRRKAILFVAMIVGAAACGIGGAALGSLLLSCGGEAVNKPVVAPNKNGADCLVERQMLQLTCVGQNTTRPAIDKCIADAKLPDCTTEAGITDFITSRDAGADR